MSERIDRGFEDGERLDVDTFLERCAGLEGRHELVDGRVIAMAAERVRHTRTKALVWSELRRAVEAAKVRCEAFADGLSVRIDDRNAFEPDALINCGDPPDDESLGANSPVAVVEVVSPSSVGLDSNARLDGYFRAPSIVHYLVVTADSRRVVHFTRDGEGTPRVSIVPADAVLALEPPGVELDVAAFFGSG